MSQKYVSSATAKETKIEFPKWPKIVTLKYKCRLCNNIEHREVELHRNVEDTLFVWSSTPIFEQCKNCGLFAFHDLATYKVKDEDENSSGESF